MTVEQLGGMYSRCRKECGDLDQKNDLRRLRSMKEGQRQPGRERMKGGKGGGRELAGGLRPLRERAEREREREAARRAREQEEEKERKGKLEGAKVRTVGAGGACQAEPQSLSPHFPSAIE